MFLLSVDTSSPKGSLSIAQLNKNSFKTLSHKEWLSSKEAKKSHSEVITIYLQEALKEAQINLAQLNLILCGVGPGSFTGIRVAVNFAKSLAFSLNIKLVPISSLTSLAQINIKKVIPSPTQSEALLPLIHAFSKKIYLASYQVNDLTPLLIKQVINYHQLEELLNTQKIHTWHVSGDAYPLFEQYFSDTIKKKLKIYPKILYPNSLDMVELFLGKQEEHKKLNWKEFLPLYIRKSSAEELLESQK